MMKSTVPTPDPVSLGAAESVTPLRTPAPSSGLPRENAAGDDPSVWIVSAAPAVPAAGVVTWAVRIVDLGGG